MVEPVNHVLAFLCVLLVALLMRENARARRAEQWAEAVAAEAEAWIEEAAR